MIEAPPARRSGLICPDRRWTARRLNGTERRETARPEDHGRGDVAATRPWLRRRAMARAQLYHGLAAGDLIDVGTALSGRVNGTVNMTACGQSVANAASTTATS